MMKRLLATTLLIGALSGCSGADPAPVAAPEAAVTPVPPAASTQPPVAAPSPSPTRPAAATTTATAANRAPRADRKAEAPPSLDRFVALVRRELPQVAVDRRDEEVAALGEQACDALAAGRKNAAVVGEISEQGVAAVDARRVLALARDSACPS